MSTGNSSTKALVGWAVCWCSGKSENALQADFGCWFSAPQRWGLSLAVFQVHPKAGGLSRGVPAQICIFKGPLWVVHTRLRGTLGLRAVESSLQWSRWKMGTPAWRELRMEGARCGWSWSWAGFQQRVWPSVCWAPSGLWVLQCREELG